MDIDAVIAEATTVAEPAKAPEAPTAETPQEVIVKEEPAKPQIKPDGELTPEQLAKREANRRSHAASREAKMKRELRELRDLVQKTATQPPTQQTNGEPTPPDPSTFDDWDKLQAAERQYTRDLARWEAKQEFSERDKQTSEIAESAAAQAQMLKRIEEIGQKEVEFIKANPSYKALYDQHSDFMNNMPKQVAEALMEADDANLALFALMNEGKLESLEDMSPYRISMEIGKAEIRGAGYLNQNKATNAPAPVDAARGTGNPTRNLDQLSVEELLNKYN